MKKNFLLMLMFLSFLSCGGGSGESTSQSPSNFSPPGPSGSLPDATKGFKVTPGAGKLEGGQNGLDATIEVQEEKLTGPRISGRFSIN